MGVISYLILCGLPASGKTRLAYILCNKEHVVNNEENIFYWHICYDLLISLFSVNNSEDDNKKEVTWKLYRKACLLYVDQLTSKLLGKENNVCDENFMNWFSNLPNDLHQIGDVSHKHLVFIIDDNMHLKSMRHEYYQLARKYQIGFATAYLNVTLENALEANIHRKNNFITSDIIKHMAERFEAPDDSSWEKNVVTIYPEDFLNFSATSKVNNLICNASKQPVLPRISENKLQERLTSKLICTTNTVHQADLILRKIASQIIKQARVNNAHDMTIEEISSIVLSLKLKTLHDIREKIKELETQNQLEIFSNNNLNLSGFVIDLFKDHLANTVLTSFLNDLR